MPTVSSALAPVIFGPKEVVRRRHIETVAVGACDDDPHLIKSFLRGGVSTSLEYIFVAEKGPYARKPTIKFCQKFYCNGFFYSTTLLMNVRGPF